MHSSKRAFVLPMSARAGHANNIVARSLVIDWTPSSVAHAPMTATCAITSSAANNRTGTAISTSGISAALCVTALLLTADRLVERARP